MSKDKDGKDEIKSSLLVKGNQEKDLIIKDDDDDDDESRKLLLPARKGGLSTNSSDRKHKQKVQWNDMNGDKLTEVLEYQPR